MNSAIGSTSDVEFKHHGSQKCKKWVALSTPQFGMQTLIEYPGGVFRGYGCGKGWLSKLQNLF